MTNTQVWKHVYFFKIGFGFPKWLSELPNPSLEERAFPQNCVRNAMSGHPKSILEKPWFFQNWFRSALRGKHSILENCWFFQNWVCPLGESTRNQFGENIHDSKVEFGPLSTFRNQVWKAIGVSKLDLGATHGIAT